MSREPHKLLKGGTFAYTAISEELGSANAGLFMSQLVWLCFDSKVAQKVGIGQWIYQTNEQIRAVTKLSRRELEYGRRIALKKGWVETIKKGIPAKTYYKVTQKFDDWCYTRPSDKKADVDCDLQDAQNEQTEMSSKNHKSEPSVQGCAKRTALTAQNAPCNKERYKESYKENNFLSVCEQTDDVDVLVEVEKCLPKNQISKEQLMSRWNKLAEKYCFKTHRIFNTAWEKDLVKANKMIGKFHKEGWEEFFRCVEEIMIAYHGRDYVKYFNLGFALRPEKFQNILGEVLSYPKNYDTDVIKRIVARLRSKQEKLALLIRHFETKGDKKMMMKKHKRWKANREAISKWQEILIGESK